MATSKKKPQQDAPRGVPLVEQVIAAIAAQRRPPPLAPEVVAAARLADGRPLPPSLQRFLATHGPRQQFPGDWRPGAGSALDHVDIRKLIADAYEPEVRRYFDVDDIAEKLPGRCHRLDSDTPLSFLYVGEPDRWGEYPVLTIQDYDDVLEVVVDYPGLDVYLACRAQVVPRPRYYGGIAEHPVYGRMLAEVVKRNFPVPPKRRQKQWTFPIPFRA